MDFFGTDTAMELITPFWNTVAQNIAGLFLVLGIVVAISFVMAIIEINTATFTWRGKKYHKYK